MVKIKPYTKSTIHHYRNDKLREFYTSLKDEHDRQVAIETVIFIKLNFPECREILRGKLIDIKEG